MHNVGLLLALHYFLADLIPKKYYYNYCNSYHYLFLYRDFQMSAKFQTRYDERIKAPSFEEIDRKDPVAFKAARDRWNLERLIELEIVKIYRDRVTECHRREEVNARQNCRKVVSDYMKAFNEYKRKGM